MRTLVRTIELISVAAAIIFIYRSLRYNGVGEATSSVIAIAVVISAFVVWIAVKRHLIFAIKSRKNPD